jgi:23S rRNA (adenine-N6)-dimethyltransferase
VAGERAQPARRRGAYAQHFLRSSRLAADVVRSLELDVDDLVVEIGAGTGRLTVELARRAAHVVAFEIDPALAATLRVRLPAVAVVEGDALMLPLPCEPFRVVGNLPFNRTTEILRRVLDPRLPLTRADVIVQWGFASKRAAVIPSTRLGLEWGPWHELSIVRRLDASAFTPAPGVDAALLRITRREEALVAVEEESGYRSFVQRGFESGLPAIVPPRTLKQAAGQLGFRRGSAARDLDVHQWAGLFALARRTPSGPSG